MRTTPGFELAVAIMRTLRPCPNVKRTRGSHRPRWTCSSSAVSEAIRSRGADRPHALWKVFNWPTSSSAGGRRDLAGHFQDLKALFDRARISRHADHPAATCASITGASARNETMARRRCVEPDTRVARLVHTANSTDRPQSGSAKAPLELPPTLREPLFRDLREFSRGIADKLRLLKARSSPESIAGDSNSPVRSSNYQSMGPAASLTPGGNE